MIETHSESLLWPSTAEVEDAYAIIGRLVSQGADPQLQADGSIVLGGPATPRQSQWCREHREAFRSALVGSQRYVKGSLDRIYGIVGVTNERGITTDGRAFNSQ